jgi:hypothetical protein
MVPKIILRSDIGDLRGLPISVKRNIRLASESAMQLAVEYLYNILIESLPSVYGRLIRAVKKKVIRRKEIVSGTLYVARRSGGFGSATTDVYANYLENGTFNYSSLPPIFPLRLWIVRKFGARGRDAWKRAKGLQVKIFKHGTRGNQVWRNVNKFFVPRAMKIFEREFSTIFNRLDK